MAPGDEPPHCRECGLWTLALAFYPALAAADDLKIDPNRYGALVYSLKTGKYGYSWNHTSRIVAERAAFAVGDTLRDIPLFLTGELHVPMPLGETYQSAWTGFLAPLRPLLEASAAPG